MHNEQSGRLYSSKDDESTNQSKKELLTKVADIANKPKEELSHLRKERNNYASPKTAEKENVDFQSRVLDLIEIKFKMDREFQETTIQLLKEELEVHRQLLHQLQQFNQTES